VVRRAAARDRNFRNRTQQILVHLEFGCELRIARFVDASGESLLHDARLDEHLLEHEMLEAVFFGRTRIPHNLRDFTFDRVAVEIGERVAVLRDDDHLMFA